MSTEPEVPKIVAVPQRVFEKFLEAAAADVPSEVVLRLRKTLVEEKVFSEAALKTAIFGDETAP